MFGWENVSIVLVSPVIRSTVTLSNNRYSLLVFQVSGMTILSSLHLTFSSSFPSLTMKGEHFSFNCFAIVMALMLTT